MPWTISAPLVEEHLVHRAGLYRQSAVEIVLLVVLGVGSSITLGREEQAEAHLVKPRASSSVVTRKSGRWW